MVLSYEIRNRAGEKVILLNIGKQIRNRGGEKGILPNIGKHVKETESFLKKYSNSDLKSEKMKLLLKIRRLFPGGW